MDGTSRKFISVLLLAIFAGTTLGILPIGATVDGSFDITRPDYVAVGGPVQIDGTDLTTTGGKFYFYLSADDDSDISSGDIYFYVMDYDDVEGLDFTIWVPTSVDTGEYYIKATDHKAIGENCVVSDNSIEIVDALDVEIEDASGHVADAVEISGSDLDEDADVTFYWGNFEDVDHDMATADAVDADGEFAIDYDIPDAFMDTYNILVFITEEGGDTYSTSVEFSVEPDVVVNPVVADYSVLADANDELFNITGTGFPEGTVNDDSIEVVMKELDGSSLGTFDTVHVETDVEEDATEGQLNIDGISVDNLDAGVASLRITVDSTTLTFADVFYASEAIDVGDFTSIKYYKSSPDEGVNGDDISVAVINLPAGADVEIEANGENISKDVITLADANVTDVNGAYEWTWEVEDYPGDTYSIKITITSGATEKNKIIGTFEVLPDIDCGVDEAVVGELVDFDGTGFPADSEINTVYFGSEDVEIDPAEEVGDDGVLTLADVEVPEISGGGSEITVEIVGEDVNGDEITATVTLIINEQITDFNYLEADGDWAAFGGAGPVFPGHPIQIIGNGWTSGEDLTVTLYDEDDDELGACVITDGPDADGDGVIEIVAWLPYIDELYPGGGDDVYITVEGSETGSEDTDAFVVDAAEDGNAIIWMGIEDDGGLEDTYNVGDSVRVVGVGFEDEEYTLSIDETETDVKDVVAEFGFFDVTVTLPEMEGDLTADLDYTLSCSDAIYEFDIEPLMKITPTSAYELTDVTVTGTGFNDDANDWDIAWVGTAMTEVLDTVDADDVDDGTFTITVTIPASVPQAYLMQVGDADLDTDDDDYAWEDATFTVLDKNAVYTNQTLAEIIAMIDALNLENINAQLAAAQASSAAATTAANAATAAANAATAAATSAGSKADAATAAATAAGTKADAAVTAANAAAVSAKSAADAANGLTTLVYAAIGASLIAALAAIVALMQISRKIA